MTDKNHFAALQEIRSWNTSHVIWVLKNNGLRECVEAVEKREITGDKLLELSEMTLGLWKCDLSVQNRRKLALFVQDISKSPAKFVCSASSCSDDAWDTDFDDDLEDESNHKTGNTIPYRTHTGRSGHTPSNKKEPKEETRISDVKTIIQNTHRNNNPSPKVNKCNSFYSRRKINIPSIFASEKSSNPKMHELSASTTKLSSMKGEHSTNNKEENVKPSIPCRPASLYSKSSLPETATLTTLPKPPVFDKEGSVLREICEKLTLEHDIIDEYEGIDYEMLLARSNNNKNVIANGFGGSQHSLKHNNADGSHTLSSNNGLQVSHIPNKISEDTKSEITSVPEDKKMNGFHNSASSIPTQKGLISHEEISKSLNSLIKDFQNDGGRKSPNLMAPRDEIKRENSPVSRLHNNSPKHMQRDKSNTPSPVPFKVVMSDLENHFKENSNVHSEEFYEIIPESVRSCSSKSNDNEHHSPSKRSPTPPSLPPKPKFSANEVKSSGKSNKSETNSSSSSFWPFGSPKEKGQPKEKATQDAKRTNTLPKPRPANSYVNELPRASATRPLPPPPLEGGQQRPVKIPLVQMPWYFNIDRKKAEEMLRNSEDGMFVIRPSTQTQNPLTLTLKYGSRSFNIYVRHRPDGRYALGTVKPTEQTFSSVEELVNHYMSNELLLYSNGTQAGTVRLTSPPRKDQLNLSLAHSS